MAALRLHLKYALVLPKKAGKSRLRKLRLPLIFDCCGLNGQLRDFLSIACIDLGCQTSGWDIYVTKAADSF